MLIAEYAWVWCNQHDLFNYVFIWKASEKGIWNAEIHIQVDMTKQVND